MLRTVEERNHRVSVEGVTDTTGLAHWGVENIRVDDIY